MTLTSGLSLPEIAALNVLRSGLLAMAWEAFWLAIEVNEPAPPGISLR